MKVTRHNAIQVHPVPTRAYAPYGAFHPELFIEPAIVQDYAPALNEDGYDFEPGSTAQNDFSPERYLFCGSCFEKVRSTETDKHVCEEE